jgi:hypothetical protein
MLQQVVIMVTTMIYSVKDITPIADRRNPVYECCYKYRITSYFTRTGKMFVTKAGRRGASYLALWGSIDV